MASYGTILVRRRRGKKEPDRKKESDKELRRLKDDYLCFYLPTYLNYKKNIKSFYAYNPIFFSVLVFRVIMPFRREVFGCIIFIILIM